MSKRECPFCKEIVKYNATICKHCRSKLPPVPPKKWYQTWKGLLLLLFVLAMFGKTFYNSPSISKPDSVSGKHVVPYSSLLLDGVKDPKVLDLMGWVTGKLYCIGSDQVNNLK